MARVAEGWLAASAPSTSLALRRRRPAPAPNGGINQMITDQNRENDIYNSSRGASAPGLPDRGGGGVVAFFWRDALMHHMAWPTFLFSLVVFASGDGNLVIWQA